MSRGFQTLVYWFGHQNYVPKLKKNHYGLSNTKISSLFMGIEIPQRSPHIWNQEHSFPNWETLGAPHRTRVYCLGGNIRSTVSGLVRG